MTEPTHTALNNVLAIHPSYAAPEERCFWEELVFHIGGRGWNYIPVTYPDLAPPRGQAIYMPIPHIAGAATMHPANAGADGLPAWATEADIERLFQWTAATDALERPQEVRSNLRAYAAWADLAVRALRPALVLLTSQLPLTMLTWMAARHHGIRTLFYERSPCGGIWLEPEGQFADSQVWSRCREVEAGGRQAAYRAAGEQVVADLLANPAGFRKGEDRGDAWPAPIKKGPIFLMLMDNILFSGWEPRGWPKQQATYPLYDTHQEAVAHVAALARRLGGTLVLKRHPICRVYGPERPAWLPDDVVYYDGPVQTALRAADVVIGFITKTLFPALAMRKPVVTLAQNPAAASGGTYHPAKRDEVEQALRDAAGQVDLARKCDRFVPFAGWIARDYYFSYTSPPSPYPALAGRGGICRAARGPAAVLDAFVPDADRIPAMPFPELTEAVVQLRYRAGTWSKELEPPPWALCRARIFALAQGTRRVAIYGAGQFARQLFQRAAAADMLAAAGAEFRVFDDRLDTAASAPFPVHAVGELPAYAAGANDRVLLATDTWQASMRARLQALHVDPAKVFDLFDNRVR